MVTIETEAADSRLKDFIDKANAFKEDEKMNCLDFSKFCDISPSTWNNVNHGMFKTNVYTAIKISNATGISI